MGRTHLDRPSPDICECEAPGEISPLGECRACRRPHLPTLHDHLEPECATGTSTA